MTSSNFAPQTSFDDIVFEGRNREYGAYLLRKIYNRNLFRGLVTAISLFLLFLSLPLIINKFFPQEFVIPTDLQTDTGHIITDVELPDVLPVTPPAPIETAPPPQQAIKIEKFTDFIIKKHVTNPTDIPDQDKLSNALIGTVAKDGESGVKPPVDLPVTGGGGGGTGEVLETKIFTFVEQMPEFPGGETAMLKYLSNNISYPSVAQRNGLQGLVVLSFVVNQQGEISDIQILKNLGGGTEAEAIRVVKSMPRWNPGKNNGIPVNVRFTLPIKFAIK